MKCHIVTGSISSLHNSSCATAVVKYCIPSHMSLKPKLLVSQAESPRLTHANDIYAKQHLVQYWIPLLLYPIILLIWWLMVVLIVVFLCITIIWLLFQTLHLLRMLHRPGAAQWKEGTLAHHFCKDRGDDNQDDDDNNENMENGEDNAWRIASAKLGSCCCCVVFVAVEYMFVAKPLWYLCSSDTNESISHKRLCIDKEMRWYSLANYWPWLQCQWEKINTVLSCEFPQLSFADRLNFERNQVEWQTVSTRSVGFELQLQIYLPLNCHDSFLIWLVSSPMFIK